ncbi:hypothetical protein [Bradyrhizobium prioriisuperbiae]|uniref:hypothetical protein n=1 Tax=Bradyrhizobium prioriisuperbiae TaxID=2854389 RepID=UPI0028E92D1D|nr:hypothetical protein [Bradyrhizobium prioritasuperba]
MIHLVLHMGRSVATSPTVIRTAAALANSLLAIATRLIAGSLNMPEALLRDTGEFVVAYVAEVEQRSALVCPRRVMRELRQRRHISHRGPSQR